MRWNSIYRRLLTYFQGLTGYLVQVPNHDFLTGVFGGESSTTTCIRRIFVDERFDTIMSQDAATASKPKDFSSIARWLLLNNEVQSNSSKVCYGEIQPCSTKLCCGENQSNPSESTTARRLVSNRDIQLNASKVCSEEIQPTSTKFCCGENQSNLSKMICDCNLCSRIRGITEERLTAPLERPYSPVQNKNAPCGRPQFGPEGRLVIRNVRKFFEEFKDMLSSSGPALRSTILNMPVLMTSLACGVSLKTVTNHVRKRQERKQEEKRVRQSILMKSYIAEWGVVVRHFVNNELKEGLDVTVSDLYAKICYAYADFPMPEAKFHKFLKIIGFSVREDEGKTYVVLRSDPKSEVCKPKGELFEPKSEDVEGL